MIFYGWIIRPKVILGYKIGTSTAPFFWRHDHDIRNVWTHCSSWTIILTLCNGLRGHLSTKLTKSEPMHHFFDVMQRTEWVWQHKTERLESYVKINGSTTTAAPLELLSLRQQHDIDVSAWWCPDKPSNCGMAGTTRKSPVDSIHFWVIQFSCVYCVRSDFRFSGFLVFHTIWRSFQSRDQGLTSIGSSTCGRATWMQSGRECNQSTSLNTPCQILSGMSRVYREHVPTTLSSSLL